MKFRAVRNQETRAKKKARSTVTITPLSKENTRLGSGSPTRDAGTKKIGGAKKPGRVAAQIATAKMSPTFRTANNFHGAGAFRS